MHQSADDAYPPQALVAARDAGPDVHAQALAAPVWCLAPPGRLLDELSATGPPGGDAVLFDAVAERP